MDQYNSQISSLQEEVSRLKVLKSDTNIRVPSDPDVAKVYRHAEDLSARAVANDGGIERSGHEDGARPREWATAAAARAFKLATSAATQRKTYLNSGSQI